MTSARRAQPISSSSSGQNFGKATLTLKKKKTLLREMKRKAPAHMVKKRVGLDLALYCLVGWYLVGDYPEFILPEKSQDLE